MVKSIVGVYSWLAIIHVAFSNSIHHCAVRILHIMPQIAAAASGIFRNAPNGELSCFTAIIAGKGFLGNRSVSVKLICAIYSAHPDECCQGYL